MRISAELLDAVVAHARREHPNECCGLIACREGRAVAIHEMRNTAASPLRFEVDGLELHHLLTAIEDRGEELGAIYHSHTRSAPHPSQTDVNFAAAWPGVEWLIVGLPKSGIGDSEVRSYLIDAGRVEDAGVRVEGDA